jgi:hypothetical protein
MNSGQIHWQGCGTALISRESARDLAERLEQTSQLHRIDLAPQLRLDVHIHRQVRQGLVNILYAYDEIERLTK